MAKPETGLSIISRIFHIVKTRRTMIKVRARTETARAELEEAENIEKLIEGLFTAYDEMLDEIDKAGQSVQRATTKVRNIVTERKKAISEIMNIDFKKKENSTPEQPIG